MSAEATASTPGADGPWWTPLRDLLADTAYRRYWAGSAGFGFGIWGYLTAMGWSARRLSDTALGVSMVNVVYFLPMFLLALPSGVLADAMNRRTTAVAVRGFSAVTTTVLIWQAATGALTYRWLLVHAFLTGATVVLELASRQAYLVQLVPMAQLVRASALSAVQAGASRFVGPILAGVMIDALDDAGGYAVLLAGNVLFVVMFMRIPVSGAVPERDAATRPLAEMIDGLRYLRGHRDAATLVLISILAGMVGWIHVALMPLIATDVLGGGGTTLGTLGTALGLGSVPPSIILVVRRDLPREGRWFVVSMVLWAGAIAGFAAASTLWLSVLALGVAGLGFGFQTILTRTMLLRIVDPAYHGRVMGTLMLTFGANIIGTLIGGSVADVVGVQAVIALSGGLILAVTLGMLAWNPRVWDL